MSFASKIIIKIKIGFFFYVRNWSRERRFCSNKCTLWPFYPVQSVYFSSLCFCIITSIDPFVFSRKFYAILIAWHAIREADISFRTKIRQMPKMTEHLKVEFLILTTIFFFFCFRHFTFDQSLDYLAYIAANML
jgi:hypothetical protein